MEFQIFHVGAFRSPGLSCRDGRPAACRSGKTVGASSLESPTQNWKPWDLDLDFMDFLSKEPGRLAPEAKDHEDGWCFGT